jgi:hypothetical protein
VVSLKLQFELMRVLLMPVPAVVKKGAGFLLPTKCFLKVKARK